MHLYATFCAVLVLVLASFATAAPVPPVLERRDPSPHFNFLHFLGHAADLLSKLTPMTRLIDTAVHIGIDAAHAIHHH
ncbi:hypothetical protein FRC18_010426 [Serendipita sp. 400]|nr:hypothetical protein FRC18_010426 [Serendipita sp. 400]